MKGQTLVKVYPGTPAQQDAAYAADQLEARRLGWEPIRRERMPDSLRVTYRIIGSDVVLDPSWKR